MSGKNLGMNGIGPDMETVSPVPLASLSSRSRRAANILRRMMLIAIPKENKAKTPTLPPRAPANVAILFFLPLAAVGVEEAEIPAELAAVWGVEETEIPVELFV